MKSQTLYMTCELNKERDVIWKRDGEVLKKKAGKVQINIIGMQHAVTIQGTTEAEAGVYTCEVAGQESVKTTTTVKVIGKQKMTLYILQGQLHRPIQVLSKECILQQIRTRMAFIVTGRVIFLPIVISNQHGVIRHFVQKYEISF